MKEHDQEFIENLVKELVDNPNDVSADRTVDEMGVLLTLKVNPEDLGQVIGRQGQTAKAIRTLLRVVGAKNHARVNLKIYEPEGYRRPPRDQREAPGEDGPMPDIEPMPTPDKPLTQDEAMDAAGDLNDLKL